MAYQYATPYSWELRDHSENDAGISTSFSGLNVAAKPFVPNAASYSAAQPSEPSPPTAPGSYLKCS